MPSKSKKKPATKKVPKSTSTLERVAQARERGLVPEAKPAYTDEQIQRGDVLGGCAPPDELAYVEETQARRDAAHADALALAAPQPPAALTLPLIADSATLFIQGAQQLTAQLLGTPECAPLLVRINEWLEALGSIKKLIAGDAEGPISGLKAKVISDGEPWGEKGSKQLTLAGAVVKVKAVNWRDESKPLEISDLDEKKVEAYLRGVPWNDPIEKVLACYMRPVTNWTLKDLPPKVAANLASMLADPGIDGQGLRQCLKDTKYQMLSPTMETP